MNLPRRGCLQVYTGNGKGKTTASLGLTLRSVGHGHKVFIIQFMKGSDNYGELEAARKYLPGVTIEQYGLETFVSRENPSPEDRELAQKGIARAREIVAGGEHDLVILDELNVALDYNLVTLDQVMDLISARPTQVELVLTGRGAHQKVIEAADLVTEVTLVKHPFYKGIEAREGIEY
ncbi:MAG: cobinamide adenolsyltransferase [Peptococcaceae bacterium BICA1-7]|nr:MAG: cobinamide adenolsyltransferase [Peptococcaceae bacterium BICA1-7]HBV97650.1 cob(I)yrinic acid a,c-diamide adenosyltransferase [Desulfotomaculum sp.]